MALEIEGFDEWEPQRSLENGDLAPLLWGEREVFWRQNPLESEIQTWGIFTKSVEGENFSDKFRRIGFGFGGRSERLSTLGVSDPNLLILGINGMNLSRDDALSHQAYLHTLPDDKAPIDFIYNRSNRFLTDVGEIFFLNYFGISPFTSKLLQGVWEEFAKEHEKNPEKKILQFCHSQAAIHVYNALLASPQDLRDRVIVVSFAPAKVIPQSICHASFNYASKRDVVHYGELIFASALDLGSHGVLRSLKKALEHREQLILLDPDPTATGIDHDFQSPTFKNLVKAHLEDYIQRDGNYPIA